MRLINLSILVRVIAIKTALVCLRVLKTRHQHHFEAPASLSISLATAHFLSTPRRCFCFFLSFFLSSSFSVFLLKRYQFSSSCRVRLGRTFLSIKLLKAFPPQSWVSSARSRMYV